MRRDGGNTRNGTIVMAKLALFVLVMLGVAGLSPRNSQAEMPGSYVVLKGGIYSPSATFDLGNVDVETTFDGDTETGVAGEIAFGHHVLPTLALELGIGYFNGKGTIEGDTPTAPRRKADFDVIPLLLSAKVLMPMGQVEPYGELGVGAYFTKFDVSDNLNTFDGSTTLGVHAGAGLNIPIAQSIFLGFEGRYVWANPSFGDQKIKLNDTEYALNGFELNGFTTMAALGYRF
jgi:outer membrane protein W